MHVRRADRNQGGVGDLAYPLVSDLKREITQKYNVLTADGVALRGLFIIDKEVRADTRSDPIMSCVPARAALRAGGARLDYCKHATVSCMLACACLKAGGVTQ